MNYNSFVYDQQLKTNAPMQMAYAIVEFRPLDSYDGDFGFDWFRVGDCGDKAFKDIIISPLSQLENEFLIIFLTYLYTAIKFLQQ